MSETNLTEQIIGCAMKVHRALGPGFLESVYHKALAHELAKTGQRVERERRVVVHYDGVVVGEFVVDMLVGGEVLVELKANQALSSANEAQVVNYLVATGIEVGLLLNFGGASLEIKRKTRTYKPKDSDWRSRGFR